MKRKIQLETVIVCLFLRVWLGTKSSIILSQTQQKSHGIGPIPWLFCWVWDKIMGILVPDRTRRNRQTIAVSTCKLSFIHCGPIITQITADVWALQDIINCIFVTLSVCVPTGMFLCTRREWTRWIYYSQNPWPQTTTTDVNNGSKLTFFVMDRVWVTDLTSGPSKNLWPLRRETTRFTYLIMITKAFNLRNIYYGTTYFVVKWKIWNSLLLNLYPVLKRLHSQRVVSRRRG